MFCPKCQAEYREGCYRCADCNIDLVVSLSTTREADALVLVWRGSDPVAFSRVIDVLTDADIAFDVQAKHDHLTFELGMPRPFYEVRVSGSLSDEASRLISPIGDLLPLAPLIHDPSLDREEDPSSEDR